MTKSQINGLREKKVNNKKLPSFNNIFFIQMIKNHPVLKDFKDKIFIVYKEIQAAEVSVVN